MLNPIVQGLYDKIKYKNPICRLKWRLLKHFRVQQQTNFISIYLT